MPYMTALEAALVRFELGPYLEEVDGWESRGSRSFAPGGSVGHHTGGARYGDRPSLALVVNGRRSRFAGDPAVPAPLANTFTSRSKVILVAAGRANHAGKGGYRGLVGNSSVFGDEAESTGAGDWTDFQRWAFPRVHAAFLYVLGRDESWYCAHWEWTPRKIDPVGIHSDPLRAEIARLLRSPVRQAPPPVRLKPKTDIQTIEEDDMERAIIGLYEQHLDRAPSRGEVNRQIDRWATAPAGEGLRTVRAGIAGSEEAKDTAIERLYREVFGPDRKVSAEEIAGHRAAAGDDLALIRAALERSPEAQARAKTTKEES